MIIAAALLAAYIVGSVDFAVVVGRMHGVNIHEEGSGNPGTSNVMRVLGKGPATVVLAGDAFKGIIGAAMGWFAAGIGFGSSAATSEWAFAAGFFAVLGHCYPILHRFKGGRGVATGLGVLIFTIPIAAALAGATWVVLARVTKTASIASITAVALTIPLSFWQGVRSWAWFWLVASIALVVWRHKPNIRRMISGTEEKVPA